jgi:FkbH-like protein
LSTETHLLRAHPAESETAMSSREEIDALIAAGKSDAAVALLAELWWREPRPATAAFVVSRFEGLREHVPLKRCRVAFLRSFVVEPVIPLARAMAFVDGIDLEVQVGDFNAYTQEILDGAGPLYSFEPDVVFLAALTRDVSPHLWDRFPDLDEAAAREEIDALATSYSSLITAFRERSDAHLVVHTLETPPTPSAGIRDAQEPLGQVAAIRAVNDAIARAARDAHNVYVLDYDGLAGRRGSETWRDLRTWATVRLPVRGDELVHLAAEWLRFLHPLTGVTCKVLAVDLDGTLWGGVVGEDGVDGITLGDPAGAAFDAVQRAMLDLYRRGVILAVCSKNNEDDALAALEGQPGMLVRPEHFAALRINWRSKADNLREIAEELNVGLEAVAFLDDNPVERSLVRAHAPEVTVIELPDDPLLFADTLRASPVFERLGLTEEDRVRGKLYADQRQRTSLQRSAASLEDFYRSLMMVVEVRPMTDSTLPRTAQLTQKTNQFNLTTQRYTEHQLTELLAGGSRIYTVRVKDRFGDNGIVGIAITLQDQALCRIDTFLLSCRVIGRTVETAILATIADHADADGATTLVGTYVPTKKNAPARDFYSRHGFVAAGTANGASTWELALNERPLSCPPWIALDIEGFG